MDFIKNTVVVRGRELEGYFMNGESGSFFCGRTRMGEREDFAVGFYKPNGQGFDDVDLYLFDNQGIYKGNVRFLTSQVRVDEEISLEVLNELVHGLEDLRQEGYPSELPCFEINTELRRMFH